MKNSVVKAAQNPFFQGGIFLTAASFITGFLNYLFNSLAGKALGPSGYSEIAALFSYGILFLIPVQVISIDLIRRIGEKGKDKAVFVKALDLWFWEKIRRWKWVFVPYFLLTLILPRITNLSVVFSLTLLITTLLTFLSTFYLSALQGLHLFFAYSLIGIVATIIKLFGPMLVLVKVDGLSTIALFLILSSVSTVYLAIFFIKRSYMEVNMKTEKVEKRLRAVLFDRWMIITMMSLLSINLLNNLDVIFVKKFFPASSAGIYGAWGLFAKIIFYLVGPITGLSYVFFASYENKKKHLQALMIFLLISLAIGIVMFFIYHFFGLEVIRTIFNDEYISIQRLLPLAAIFGFFYTMITILNGFFLAKKSFFCLISACAVPFYFLSLFIFGKSIETVIIINIIVTGIIFLLSLVVTKFVVIRKLRIINF